MYSSLEEVTMIIGYIFHQKYRNNVQDYQELTSEWISWAVRNNIPLDALDSLPYAGWYFWKHTIARWAESYLKFGNGTLQRTVLDELI